MMLIPLQFIKPVHPNISIHFLHTLLHSFPLVLTRRIHLTILLKLHRLAIMSFILVILMNVSAVLLKEELDAGQRC